VDALLRHWKALLSVAATTVVVLAAGVTPAAAATTSNGVNRDPAVSARAAKLAPGVPCVRFAVRLARSRRGGWVPLHLVVLAKPPLPFDPAVRFPRVAPHARTATRLHPRPGQPAVEHSHVGGPLLWPVGQEWPACPGPHYLVGQ
jgi:hypothetical protein